MGRIRQIGILLITLIILLVQTVLGFRGVFFSSSTPGLITYILFDVYMIYMINKIHIRQSTRNGFFSKMLIIILVYNILYYYLGFVLGFTKSPYAHTLPIILMNSIKTLIPILGIELARYIFINKNKDSYISMIIFTIILIALEINIPTIQNLLVDREAMAKYLFKTILPLIASSAFFSYLVTITTYKTTLLYRIFSVLVLYIMPLYPDVNWFLDSALGVILPAVYYALYKFVFTKQEKTTRKSAKKGKTSLYITIVAMSLLVAFMLGAFKCEPVTIVSNSMLPVYSRGDVIIYEKMSSDDLIKLEKDSIIVYRVENQLIAHRVVNVIHENGTIKFQTKGDNNNAPDSDLVAINQIIGVYRFHLKFIGYPSVWLNDFFNDEEAVVETK